MSRCVTVVQYLNRFKVWITRHSSRLPFPQQMAPTGLSRGPQSGRLTCLGRSRFHLATWPNSHGLMWTGPKKGYHDCHQRRRSSHDWTGRRFVSGSAARLMMVSFQQSSFCARLKDTPPKSSIEKQLHLAYGHGLFFVYAAVPCAVMMIMACGSSS